MLRHAKATSQGPDDHGRVLTARGRRQAAAVGSQLARDPVPTAQTPRLVLTSSARRAVQTAELVVAELEVGVELMVERALYGADPDDVIDILRGLDDDVTSVMVVGHNPTMHELALGLLDGEDTEAVTVLERGFPTAALAVLGVTDHVWTTVTLGSATFLDLRTVDH